MSVSLTNESFDGEYYAYDDVNNASFQSDEFYECDEKLIPDLKKAKDGEEHSQMRYFNLKNLPFDDKNGQLCKIIERILKKD